MIELQSSVEIRRPVEDVFAFLSDLGNAPRWQRGVVESRVITPGPMRTGTRFSEQVRMMGMRFEAQCEVTSYDPPRRLGMSADGRMIRYEGAFTFEPTKGGSTRLSVSGRMRLKGLWRLLEPLAAGEIRKESLAELEDIKGVLEKVDSATPARETTGAAG